MVSLAVLFAMPRIDSASINSDSSTLLASASDLLFPFTPVSRNTDHSNFSGHRELKGVYIVPNQLLNNYCELLEFSSDKE